jgi:hypothetical protein
VALAGVSALVKKGNQMKKELFIYDTSSSEHLVELLELFEELEAFLSLTTARSNQIFFEIESEVIMLEQVASAIVVCHGQIETFTRCLTEVGTVCVNGLSETDYPPGHYRHHAPKDVFEFRYRQVFEKVRQFHCLSNATLSVDSCIYLNFATKTLKVYEDDLRDPLTTWETCIHDKDNGLSYLLDFS